MYLRMSILEIILLEISMGDILIMVGVCLIMILSYMVYGMCISKDDDSDDDRDGSELLGGGE